MGKWPFCLTGGIVPVLKTDDMTQPVGVALDGRLYTAPAAADVSELENDVENLETRVTTLENQQQAGGGNCYVEVPSQITCAADTLYVTYTTLPNGAVIDKYEFNVLMSGMTAPTKIEILPIASGGVTTVADGGYISWTIAHGTSGNVTIDTLTITLNTLLTNSITANDICNYARIYYHV